ncbi:VOC family protein [Dysgonomonas sp. ZJ709]|uniref:VOC family protein n=1 Tax=Dysgonomonas sp. ZJ709 TaxID=2709797 RepID=UPI0013EAEF73|nr:VOC family protein [Dysgonomonas sp. ZJ709]
MLVKPTLVFDGNAEEALTFYSKILNGNVEELLRIGDVDAKDYPPVNDLKEEDKKRIMNSRLNLGKSVFNICDTAPGVKVIAGNNITMDIVLYDDKEIHQIFISLSEGGKILMPLTTTFFSPNYGILIDKFGICWNIMQM